MNMYDMHEVPEGEQYSHNLFGGPCRCDPGVVIDEQWWDGQLAWHFKHNKITTEEPTR